MAKEDLGGVLPLINAHASVDSNIGTPEVSVEKTGAANEPTFNFDFKNLKGDPAINDNTPSTSSTYSSQKITDLLTSYLVNIGTLQYTDLNNVPANRYGWCNPNTTANTPVFQFGYYVNLGNVLELYFVYNNSYEIYERFNVGGSRTEWIKIH